MHLISYDAHLLCMLLVTVVLLKGDNTGFLTRFGRKKNQSSGLLLMKNLMNKSSSSGKGEQFLHIT